jgi:hypothetical protein
MTYFHISTGLRGCYMSDNSYVVRVRTRRELKSALTDEAARYRDAGYVGASKRAIATIAAEAWRARKHYQLPYALPVAPPHAPRNYCEAVFVSTATRDEYLASQEECI